MQILTKYEIGDTVWYTNGFSYSFEVKCLLCDGSGKVELKSGQMTSCGSCRGKGLHRLFRPYKIRPQYGKILSIHFTTDKWPGPGVVYYLDNYSFPKKEFEVYKTFFAARQSARKDNKQYGWPKDKFDRWEYSGMATQDYPDRCYWGERLRKNIGFRNVE